jgi:DNA primase
MVWVDFAEIKRSIDIPKVLAHYNLTEGMEERGNTIKVFCPFHGYPSEEPTLSITVTEDNTKFRCFASGCDASGNGVDLVARMAQTQHLNHEPQTAWNSLSHNRL